MMSARWLAGTLLTAALAAPVAGADSVADFYSGREINLVVGYGPGGGHDIYARLLARHLSRFIPGHPNIVVRNKPGAGSLHAVNYLYNAAPRDGTTFGTFARSMPFIGLLDANPSIQFDPRKLTWIGSSSSFVNDANILLVRKDAPVKTIDEARRPDRPALVLGGSAEGAYVSDVPIILRDTIGLHLKQVVGYPDSKTIFLAMERGEIHGRTVDLSTVKLVRPEWLKPDSAYRVLVQFARATRHYELADVPTARELAKNEAARALIELAELPYALSRPFAAPPEVPVDRATALQRAFLGVHGDPKYQDEAARLKIDVSPVGADGVLQALERIAGAPSEIVDYMRRLLAETRGGG
jgi:tripartite-type tricarboxylate transporter receptor subunit TctC